MCACKMVILHNRVQPTTISQQYTEPILVNIYRTIAT